MKGKKQFYLLQCSPHFHQSVLSQLSRSSIAYYNPVVRTFCKRRDCSAYRGQIMPMFPGYVFVLLDFEVVHPSCFTRMKNVYGLVSFGEYPAEVAQGVIDEVREHERLLSMNLNTMEHSHLTKILLLSNPSERGRVFVSYLCRKYDRLKNDSYKRKAETAA
ncbi:transcription termination factor NusG [Salmonella enterica]|uniref:transcription termination/antitermination NusG family protein n=2 Tax=Salmonella enterica TaxID=28901 RepID=UPI0008FC30C7|nr:transcription termination/antitermination NusG family protein [Salmonella enterica]EAA8418785.1 transcription termination factor NusG [Salmonella enterica subsp. enterica]EAA9181569.1 transcription termination factor NusG [Salmonella enterica subsp. enterica serovar Javiana]EAP3745678.1 transcription termination factor NusG [Salmonella enterica subsp. enterica serovar Minnesota]EAP4147044.1 transcription termination factor NusG [Salmonella enterica subsp. enterica serovar Anatum]EAU5269840.